MVSFIVCSSSFFFSRGTRTQPFPVLFTCDRLDSHLSQIDNNREPNGSISHSIFFSLRMSPFRVFHSSLFSARILFIAASVRLACSARSRILRSGKALRCHIPRRRMSFSLMLSDFHLLPHHCHWQCESETRLNRLCFTVRQIGRFSGALALEN